MGIFTMIKQWFFLDKESKDIPIEVTSKFDECERRLKESNGTENPTTILYEVTTGRKVGTDTGANKESYNDELTTSRVTGTEEPRSVQAENTDKPTGKERDTKRGFQPVKPTAI